MRDETTTPTLRRCIGSARFGIEPHEAPVEEFPRQPSQRDGLARMCRVHRNEYTAGLARDAKARKAAASADVGTTGVAAEEVPPAAEQPAAAPEPDQKRTRRASAPEHAAIGEVAAE